MEEKKLKKNIILLDTIRTEPLKKSTEIVLFQRNWAPYRDNICIVSHTLIWNKHVKINLYTIKYMIV